MFDVAVDDLLLPPAPRDAAPLAPAPAPDLPGGRLAPAHLQPQGQSPPPTGPTSAVGPALPEPAPSSGWQRTLTGLSLLGVAAAAGVGYAASRNFWGAGAGVLYFGAARNAVRTCRLLGSDTTEATKSGTVALFGLAGAGYLTYRALDRGDAE